MEQSKIQNLKLYKTQNRVKSTSARHDFGRDAKGCPSRKRFTASCLINTFSEVFLDRTMPQPFQRFPLSRSPFSFKASGFREPKPLKRFGDPSSQGHLTEDGVLMRTDVPHTKIVTRTRNPLQS